jgi:hypothetical protein
MSDSIFSSGGGKVLIYYAAADGGGQRLTRPADRKPAGDSFGARATIIETLTAGGGLRRQGEDR